jgi:glycosyltransferase involved in cell wall biosynthesis/SAM-dependent methyltransferase
MVKQLVWTPKLIGRFWDGLSEIGILEHMSFARLAGPSLLEFMKPWVPTGAKCLDFGGGSGHLVQLMCQAGLKTAAFEPSAQRAKATESRLSGQSSFEGAVSNWSKTTYDFVVCTEVIEHIPIDATDGFMRSLVRRVAPGGKIFLTTPYAEHLAINAVYCPTCDHEFHRWQHQRNWQVSQIVDLMQVWGIELEWAGVVGYDNPLIIRDFNLRRALLEPWPWQATDVTGFKWPKLGAGDHITFIGRKPAEVPMSLNEPERMITAGIAAAVAAGAAPIVVVPSSIPTPRADVVIVDDQMIKRARDVASTGEAGASSLASKDSMIVFPGPISLLTQAVDEGRVPRTKRALVFEGGAWRPTLPVNSPQPLATATRQTVPKPMGRLRRTILKALAGRRENLRARTIQPRIDTRRDAVLATLLNPVNFPFRMSHLMEKRVLIGIGGLYGGGAERQILNTVEGLRDRGINDVHLLVENLERGQPNAFYLEKAEGVAASIVRPGDCRKAAEAWALENSEFRSVLGDDLLKRVVDTASTIKQVAPEVVQTSLDWTNITVGLAAILAGVPHIFISGRNLGPQHFEFFQWFMYPCYQAMAAHPNVHFLNNSEAGRDDYAQWLGLPKDSIRVLRNGLHADEFQTVDIHDRNQARKSLELDQAAKVVVGAFRLSSEKRPLLWVDAAAVIRKRLPDTIFLLCGTGNMDAEVQARIRQRGLEKHVTLLGTRSDIQTIFAAANVVVQTSLQEGTPNTLIEAQAMGIPVVTTPAFGAAEAVRDSVTGYVVRKETAEAIGAAVITVLTDQTFGHDAREAGPRFIEERFGFNRMIDDTLVSYAIAGVPWAGAHLPVERRFQHYEVLRDFVHDGGTSWRVPLAHLATMADSVTSTGSPLILLEDGRPIGPAHTAHDMIRSKGGGCFSHWGEQLYLSTTDGREPSSNGRIYAVAIEFSTKPRA